MSDTSEDEGIQVQYEDPIDLSRLKDVHIDNLVYEEDILRNPYSVKAWIRYINHKLEEEKFDEVVAIYERAVKELPRSYKLWNGYLRFVCKQVRGKCVLDDAYEKVNDVFEHSIIFMNKMPRIWINYLQFLLGQCLVTRTRHSFDRALRSLPITQHHRIWPFYLKFVRKYNIKELGMRVFRRYLKLFPENAEEYIEYLQEIDKLDEAAVLLTKLVNDDFFQSNEGKSKHQLWNELCELISKNPTKIHSLNIEAIIRSGLRRYTDQLGNLWCSLADYYIRSGLFDRARDIYEEAIDTVTTVRDFTQVFDAYSQFEEFSLKKQMDQVSRKDQHSDQDDLDIEIRLSRFEYLIERRLLLLNSVLLRQNPHNVAEWHKRVSLYDGRPLEIINTYTEAVQTVDVKLAVGKLYTLWVEFAKFYEKNGQIEEARLVFEKATQVPYIKVDDLASVWCEWCEMEIRNGNYTKALSLMGQATAIPTRKTIGYYDQSESVQIRLHKSLKVWSMYADLEESFGTFKTCKAVYDRILDLRIATPQIIMNYGLFLEENNYFEEAFRAYEKGVSLFKWPNVCDIWNTYLVKFQKRYGGAKLERTRDLFEQCLESCPEKYAKLFFLMYAKFEEDFGLSRNAMSIYERATNRVMADEMLEVFNLYIKKAAEIYGISRTREIYEKAIEMLPDHQARDMCLKFTEMEIKLGEIDRARAIYGYCSQLCDPRVNEEFWEIWKEFETKYGSEDTILEMLRIKRSVLATFNTQTNIMVAQFSSNTTSDSMIDQVSDQMSETSSNDMKKLEDRHQINFVKGHESQESPKEAVANNSDFKLRQINFVSSLESQDVPMEAAPHPEDIDLDIDDDEDEDEDDVGGDHDLSTRPCLNSSPHASQWIQISRMDSFMNIAGSSYSIATDTETDSLLDNDDFQISSASNSDEESGKQRTQIRYLNFKSDYICEWRNCGYRCKIWYEFVKHLENHSNQNDGTNSCEWAQCLFGSENVSSFKYHVNYHAYYARLILEGENVLSSCQLPKCSESVEYTIPEFDQDLHCEWASCSGQFDQITEFFDHVKHHVNDIEKPMSQKRKCYWFGCNRDFKNRTRLHDHVRTHTKEKTVACPSCYHLFATKTRFFDHRKRQLSVDLHSYHCSQCAKSFASIRLLKNHMQKHINNYKCHLCDMTCPLPSTLSRHIRYKHMNSRLFKCYFCKQRFVTQYDLELHITTHISENINKCDLCSFSCRCLVTLDKHYVEVHHQGTKKVYECHCCHKQFSRGDILTKHLVKVHDFKRVSGHSRYRYIQSPNDGRYRLETVRLDSIEVTEKMVHEVKMKQQQCQQPNSKIDDKKVERFVLVQNQTDSDDKSTQFPVHFRVEIDRTDDAVENVSNLVH